MELRDGSSDDLVDVRALVFAVAGEYGFEPEPEGADADLFEHAGEYFAPGGMLRVLEQGGVIVGMVGVVPRGEGVWELRKIYLAADQRGGGQGRRLLEEALTFARAQGARKLVLQTSSKLDAALRLYERAGFVPAQNETRSCTCDVSLELAL